MINILVISIIFIAYFMGFYESKKSIKCIMMMLLIMCGLILTFKVSSMQSNVITINAITIRPAPPFVVVPKQELPTKVIFEENIMFEPTQDTIEVHIKSNKPPEIRYDFTERDIYLMTRLLCGSKYIDGDGEYDFDFGNEDQYEQISLVLCVVMNRVMDDRFPNSVEEVILQKRPVYQFTPVMSWYKKGEVEVSDASKQIVIDWCISYNEDPTVAQTIPEDHIYFTADGKGKNVSRAGGRK